MTLVPASLLNKWRENATTREYSQLEDLLELRTLIQEAKAEGEQVVMQMYSEAAPCFRMTPKALQNKLLILRNYADHKLFEWINVKGLSIDSIRTVNEYYDYGMLGGDAPGDVIDRAIEQGNENGGKPTAAEIETLILESHGIKSEEYILNKWIYRGFGFVAIARKDEFVTELKQLVERYRQ